MGDEFSARSGQVEPFLAMEVMERAFAMERAGERVLHLEIGEPDFAPPAAAVEACARALRDGETRYTDSRGLAELREAVAADYARRFGLEVSPENVVLAVDADSAGQRCGLKANDTILKVDGAPLKEPISGLLAKDPRTGLRDTFIRDVSGSTVA